MVAKSRASTLLQVFVGDRAFGGGAHEFCVFSEDTAGSFGRERFVGGQASGVVGFGDEEAQRVFDGFDFDEVAGFTGSSAFG
jgi:hypothetical protein